MFTIDQIHAAHARVKTGADFPKYVQELTALGVNHYDVFVADGRKVYYGTDGSELADPGTYSTKAIAAVGSPQQLKEALTIHQQGQTDYLTFCDQAAAAGVAKWTTNLANREVIYVDKQANTLLVEPIPQP